MKNGPGLKKQILNLSILASLIGVTMFIIFSNKDGFSLRSMGDFISDIHWPFLLGALLCMIMNIGFKGLSIGVLSRTLGYKRRLTQNYSYAAADVYFSAITPSATGGQPASAYYMVKDGMPLSIASAVLSVNLFMWTASLMALALITFALRPGLFLSIDSVIVKICIVAGLLVQVLLMAVYVMIMVSERLVIGIATRIINLLAALHITKHRDAYLDRTKAAVKRFKASVRLLRGSPRALILSFLLNFTERIVYISIGVLIFFGAKYNIPALADIKVSVLDVYALEAYCWFGAYCVPLPGAVGASEAIFNSVFAMIIPSSVLLNATMLTTRGVNFYISFLFAGLVTLIHHICLKLRRRKRSIS